MSAPRIPVANRLFDKITVDAETGCWNWTGTLSRGYGRISDDTQRMRPAHRIVWEHLVGPISAGLHLDHLCRNRRCVNPAHLEPVTCRVNVLRGAGLASQNAQATHCRHGHPFDEANTRIRPDGGRYCRACDRERYHRRRLEQAA
jgi:hypothetical protein